MVCDNFTSVGALASCRPAAGIRDLKIDKNPVFQLLHSLI